MPIQFWVRCHSLLTSQILTRSVVLIYSVKRQCERHEYLFISVSAICLFSCAACRIVMMSSALLMVFSERPKHLVAFFPAQIVNLVAFVESMSKSHKSSL